MNKSLSCLALLWAAGALHGCNADATDPIREVIDTDTGNSNEGISSTGEEGNLGGNCEETEVELDPSAQTSLGFTAQSVLDFVVGEHSSSLAWLDATEEYGPESGRSEIALTVTPLGPPVLVDREPRAASNGDSEEGGLLLGEIYSPCNDSIRIDVSIAVTTARGALDEVVETSIVANASDFAQGRFSLDLANLDGSFEATPTAPRNTEITRSSLVAELGFSTLGSVGAFSLQSEFRSLDGQAVGQGGGGALAHFPADDYCGPAAVSVTAEQSVRGLSMAQALGALNATSPSQVRYQSGAPSELTLTFSSAETRVCAGFGEPAYGQDTAGGMTLEFPGVATLSSADGRVEGNVPLQIVASNENGTIMTTAQANIDAEPSGAAALPSQFGVQDAIDFSVYDGAMVQFSSTVASDTIGGSLRVYGLDVADCVTNPPPPDPDGMGSPGCRGTDRIPLWGAFWGDWTEE
jgi:hypothetical protein